MNHEAVTISTPWSIRLVGLMVLLAGIADMLLLISFSSVDPSIGTSAPYEFYLGIALNSGQVVTATILLSGALGAFIHAATSFGYHMMKQDLGTERIWWYLLRMPIGAALGFIVVGFLKSSLVAETSTTSYNISGLISTAALAGMFSKQAIDKLAEIFESILHARSDSTSRTPSE